MSKIKLTGSNSGYVEISSAADAGNLTLALPTSGTVLLSNTDNVFSGITTTGQLDINGSIDVSSTSVFNDDVTFTGASYNVLWDKSDNQLEFGENAKLSFGASPYLQIYRDSASRITNTNGNLVIDNSNGVDTYLNSGNDIFIRPQGSEDGIKVIGDGAVELYFNAGKKFETTNTGTVIAGICTATSFSGSGEGLTRTSQYAFRNRFHNGGMTVSQRLGTTETQLNNNNWTQIMDRWKCYENTDGTLTATMVSNIYPTAGTVPSSYNSVRIKVTSDDTSLSSSQQVQFSQIIEGYNWQDLRWGTSAAKSVTVSFSVLATGASASNVTGTYCLQCTNPGTYNRAYIKEYTIDAINTWKRVSLTFPGDTSGTWDHSNNQSCRFSWFLAGDTNQYGSADTWSSYKTSTSNQKNFLSHVNNMIFFTDLQVEEGTVATPYETKPYSTELQLCQRYYQDIPANSAVYVPMNGSYARINVLFPTTMRATPSITVTPSWDGGGATIYGCMFYKSGNNTMPRMQCSSEF